MSTRYPVTTSSPQYAAKAFQCGVSSSALMRTYKNFKDLVTLLSSFDGNKKYTGLRPAIYWSLRISPMLVNLGEKLTFTTNPIKYIVISSLN